MFGKKIIKCVYFKWLIQIALTVAQAITPGPGRKFEIGGGVSSDVALNYFICV